MVLNNVNYFIIAGLKDRTQLKKVNFHEQSAIIPEIMVQYRPLLNLKKILCY